MRFRFTIYTMFILIFISCSDDTEGYIPPNGADGEEVNYTFNIAVPGFTETKAMADNEYTIREIEIMVFHDDKYVRAATARDLVKTAAGYQFEAGLKSTTDKVSLYFIANISATLRENLNRLEDYAGTVDTELAKEQAFVKFQNFVSRRDIFPMSGELHLPEGLQEGTPLPEVRMMRAFARVGIVAHENIASRFRLEKAIVHRINNHFLIAPREGAFTAQADGNYLSVTGPSVPDENQIAAMSPSDETGKTLISQQLSVSGGQIGPFYLPEGDACDPETEKPTCVILKGFYQNSTDTSYYRVDLGPKELPGEIIRNHKYTLTITSVTGPGEPSEAEALAKPSDDINTYIIWEEDGSNSIYDKDGNYLITSKRTFSLHFAKAAMDVVDIDTNFPAPYTLEWADEYGNPSGDPAIGYGGSMDNGDFKVRISADGKQIFATALKENETAVHKSGKLLGRSGQLLFTMTIDQSTKEERPYLKIYNPLGLIGDLGDEVMNAISTDPYFGTTQQKLIRNSLNFGMEGVIAFDGFRIAGQNYELPISSYLVRHYDIIYIAGNNDHIIDASEANVLNKWLADSSENQKVLVAYTTNTTLLQSLGVTAERFAWAVPSYKLSNNIPAEFSEGPFGNVSITSLSPTVNTFLYYIDRQKNPHIQPILVAGEDQVFIGVDMDKKIVFFSDPYFFDDTATNYGLLTGEGKIESDLDRLIANIWAWIAETAMGDRYDPEVGR